MKKTIFTSVLLAAMLAAGLITGCASQEQKRLQAAEQVWKGNFYAYQFERYKNPGLLPQSFDRYGHEILTTYSAPTPRGFSPRRTRLETPALPAG